jgi:GNAT superfamily N-acetyltransferase
MSTRTILILDNERDEPIEVALRDDLTPDQLLEAENEWRPARADLLRRYKKAGIDPSDWPQHWHWNWEDKAAHLSMLAYNTFGIFVEGKWQGLMMTATVGHQARLDPDKGKPLVYGEFVESAPWNLQEILTKLGEKARFRGIGTRLVEAAVCLSLDEGYHGRLGLHSLPQAQRFYKEACGMTDLGPDPKLNYFEMTRTQAGAFLKGGR